MQFFFQMHFVNLKQEVNAVLKIRPIHHAGIEIAEINQEKQAFFNMQILQPSTCYTQLGSHITDSSNIRPGDKVLISILLPDIISK